MFCRDASFNDLRRALGKASLAQHMDAERRGVPSFVAEALRDALGISIKRFASIIGTSASTYRRRIRDCDGSFSGSQALAILGVLELINLVHELPDPMCVADSRFVAARWFGEWMERPQPVLGGFQPEEFLDTPTGRQQVKRLLGAMVSSAFL